MPLKIVPDNTNIGFVRVRFVAFALTLAADDRFDRAAGDARSQPWR